MSSPSTLFDHLVHMDQKAAYAYLRREIGQLESGLSPETDDDHILFAYLFEMVRFLEFVTEVQAGQIQELQGHTQRTSGERGEPL